MPISSYRLMLFMLALGLLCANCGPSIVKFKPTDADFSFVAIGDIGEATDMMKNNAAVLKKMYREDKFDALVFLGDNFYQTGLNIPRKDVPNKISAVLDPFEEVMRGLGQKNVHAIAGNHDYYAFLAVNKKFLFGLFKIQIGPYGLSRIGNQRADTISTWTYHHETTQDTVYERQGNKIQLIFFDSALMLGTDSTVWKPILKKLENVLVDSPKDIKWRFLFAHHPFYTLGPHGGYDIWDDESGGIGYVNPCDKQNALSFLLNDLDPQDICTEAYKTYSRLVRAAIQRSGKRIDGLISGHDHSLQLLYYPKKDSACVECPKIHVISGAGSRTSHLKTTAEAEREYLWPVQTDEEEERGKSRYGFARFDFKADTLRIRFFDGKNGQTLKFGDKDAFAVRPDMRMVPTQ